MRLSSNPIQAPNQELDEMESMVPRRSVDKNNNCAEENKIKKRGSWPS